jgi:two-component system OmpR family response regulator
MVAQSTRPTVLVVETDAMTREILAQLLHVAGYEVLTADTGERALLTLREPGQRIDWLYTDVTLPGLVDGWILAEEFHHQHPLRPIIYSSTRAADLSRRFADSVFVPQPAAPMDVVMTFERLSDETDADSLSRSVPLRAAAAH